MQFWYNFPLVSLVLEDEINVKIISKIPKDLISPDISRISSEILNYKDPIKCLLSILESTQNDTAVLGRGRTVYVQTLRHVHCSGLS